MTDQPEYGFAAKVARDRQAAGYTPVLPPEVPESQRAMWDAFVAAQLAKGTPPPAVVADAVPAAAAAAFSLDPAGQPVQTGVPDDFAAAHEQAVVASGQLTAEEIAEFRALRAEKKQRDAEAAEEAARAAARLQAPTHHVHLADGTVTEGSTIATHYATGDGRLLVVTGVYELKPVTPA
jgi:hypothetical protein